ncbi:hypothetical protein [Paraburkholderia unamae]|uniref:hypothetical protein n=1 Tax=Paraburkholderia unamae TaxID=219649 RepID=UPI0010581508|nr:hypothetical protein [Paraburkholderia unamae]
MGAVDRFRRVECALRAVQSAAHRCAYVIAVGAAVPALCPPRRTPPDAFFSTGIFFPIHQIKSADSAQTPAVSGVAGRPCASRVPCDLFSISFVFFSFTVITNR